MTVYLDIILFENLIINYMLLLSTAIISKNKIRYEKIFISSLIGAIYSIINFFANIGTLANFIIKIIMSFIMIDISFESSKLKQKVKLITYFYLVSFTFGGVSFMLLFLIKPQNIVFQNNHLVGTYPIKIVTMGTILGFFIINFISKFIMNRITQKSMLCDLEIFFNGKSKKIKTMIDTGNLLKEPITKKDVIIVEKNSLKDLIEEEFLKNIKNITKGKFLDSNNDFLYSYKFTIIPFSSLGNENGILVGFSPDYVKIYDEEEKIIKNAVIGIYDGKLTKTNSYTSLIGLNILKEEKDEKKFVKNA